MQSLNINDMRATAGGRSKFFFRYSLLFTLFIICIFQFNIYSVYGFSLYPDEFGYWASAAEVLGYDWSDTAALGSYYSYGYGLILTGILWIFRDCVTAYRAAIAVNMLLQCGAVGILWGIFKRLYQAKNSDERRMQAVLAVGIAVFYPPWSFSIQMTMTEALLMFLYALICYEIILFTEKPNILSAVLLALSLLYIYFVHMRTVGIVIAAVVTLLLYAWKTPDARRKLVAALIILAVGVMCGLWIKGRITDTVYAAADLGLLSVNDYAGRFETLKSLFTVEGIRKLFFSCVGKLYYLVMASFGLFLPAIYMCLKKVWKMFQGFLSKQEDRQNSGYIYFFFLLSMMGQFAVTAIAMMSPGRLDGFIYGRYNEHLLPVLIGIGLMMVFDTEHKPYAFLINIIFSVILFGITFWNALHSGLTVMQGYFAAGISYLSDDWNYDIKTEFWKAYFFGIFLMAFFMACIYIAKRFGKYIYVLGTILLVEILLALCLGRKYTKPFNEINYYNLMIAEYMEEYEEPIVYLYGGGFPYIDLIQFAMRERKIEIVRLQDLESQLADTVQKKEANEMAAELENILPREGFLIVDQGCKYLEEIEQKYKKCAESQAFILFTAQ